MEEGAARCFRTSVRWARRFCCSWSRFLIPQFVFLDFGLPRILHSCQAMGGVTSHVATLLGFFRSEDFSLDWRFVLSVKHDVFHCEFAEGVVKYV